MQEELEQAASELGRNLTRGETMSISRARVDTAFEQASAEVKAEVAARVADEKMSLRAASRTVDVAVEPTPEEYQA